LFCSGAGAQETDGSSIEKLAKQMEDMCALQKQGHELQEEVAQEQKRVNFAMKMMTDALPTMNISIITPSVDCKTSTSGRYRSLMKSLRLNEDNNVAALAQTIAIQKCGAKEFQFAWEDKAESDSYEPFQNYLKTQFNTNAVVLAEGAGLADGNLYVSDIFTLRPQINALTSDLKKEATEPQFRYRIRGRTDLGVFKDGGVLTCGELLIAFEVKQKSKFRGDADINRALREGVLQLIGINADNCYSSPLVIVSALVGVKHYLLYLELGDKPEVDLKYHLRVKLSASLGQLIHFAKELCGRDCITRRFSSPPTPQSTPLDGTPEKGEKDQEDSEENEDFYGDNVSVKSR
jgi:hypothetical protein